MLDIADRIRPADCCLVPERRTELTTEGGLDVAGDPAKVGEACRDLAARNIAVSLFIDADTTQVDAAARCGAHKIEIHTGRYADAVGQAEAAAQLGRILEAARVGRELGLQVNAGHGLNYHNVSPIAAMDELTELNIGHAIVGRALFSGLAAAVRDMKRLMLRARLMAQTLPRTSG
jgi:pyridoxine 5-phosphate synthase